MTSPTLVNCKPVSGDTGVGALEPFRFGARDVDTRVDLTTVNLAVAYGAGAYDPANGQLPAVDDVLSAAGARMAFGAFNDASGITAPRNACDQSLAVVGGADVYRIEKSDLTGVLQEGVLFTTVDTASDVPGPVGAQVTLNLANVTAGGSYSYVDFSGFTGALIGALIWAENTAVYVFFVDDGAKKLRITGPATDGAGTRTVSEEVAFDWSSAAFVYTILVNTSPLRRTVSVYVTDASGDETRLADLDLDTFPDLQPSVAIGEMYPATMGDSLTVLVGGDFRYLADYVDVYDFIVYDFGSTLLVGGNQTAQATADVSPTESVLVYGPQGLDGSWMEEGDIDDKTGVAVVFDCAAADSYIYRAEPDLSDGEWLLMGSFFATSESHAGAYEVGAAIEVWDGTRKYRLVLLDDFAENYVGLEYAGATDLPLVPGYSVDTTISTDWENVVDFEMLGSSSHNVLQVFFGGDVDAAIEHTYLSGSFPVDSSPATLLAGFFGTSLEQGTLSLRHLWLFPSCSFYAADEGTYPEAQGWTRVAAGSASRAVSAGLLTITSNIAASYELYYLSDATYDMTSGAALFVRGFLSAWADGHGRISPIRTEIGPIMAVRVSSASSVQLFFTQTDSGDFYAYLPGGSTDLAEVQAQSAEGREISTQVDVSVEHTYLLLVKPLQHVRLHIDNNPVPSISLAWSRYARITRTDPANLPSSAIAAFGSLGESAGILGSFRHARASFGRGYDITVIPVLDEAVLQARIYGTQANVLIDVQDED